MEQRRSSSIGSDLLLMMWRDTHPPGVAATWRLAFTGSVRRAADGRLRSTDPLRDRVAFSCRPCFQRRRHPADRRAKSGRSMKASSSPATQKMCSWVNSARRPSTATISNWIFCDLWAKPLRQRMQREEQQARQQDHHDEEERHDVQEDVWIPRRRDEEGQMLCRDGVQGTCHVQYSRRHSNAAPSSVSLQQGEQITPSCNLAIACRCSCPTAAPAKHAQGR